MPDIKFKLSDGQKHEMLWNLLNSNFNESGNWTIDYVISEVYDDYAVAYNYETASYERIYYTKDDANDSLSISEKKKCYIVDVTEEEKSALNLIQSLNGGTYEKVNENFTINSEVEEKISEYEQKIEEKDTTISTLTTERDNVKAEYENIQQEQEALNNELNTLRNYKLEIEKEEKQNVIDKYSEQLDEEVINKYTEKMSEYTATDLEKELAYELVQTNPTIFTAGSGSSGRIPKDEPKTGVDAILEKYVK